MLCVFMCERKERREQKYKIDKMENRILKKKEMYNHKENKNYKM